jgi:hypothetical protein
MLVPGGVLDPSLRPRDVYLGTPVAAIPEPGTASVVAERYIALFNSGRAAELGGLFAPDAITYPPTQDVLRGREEIDGFYRKMGKVMPRLIPVAYVGNKTDSVVDIAVEMEIDGQQRFVLTVVDHFTVDDQGLITRMVAFVRADRPSFSLDD